MHINVIHLFSAPTASNHTALDLYEGELTNKY